MRSIVTLIVAASAILGVNAAHAGTITVKPTDVGAGITLNGWGLTNRRDGANTVAEINGNQKRAGNGSVQMSLANGIGKADYVYYWGAQAGRTLGNLNALSFDWYRASGGTAAAHLAPAMRLIYDVDGNVATRGDQGYLIWENVYNGGATGVPVAQNGWVSSDILADHFWQRQTSPGLTVEQYGHDLGDWINGSLVSPALLLGANASILGIEFGIGSGWNGSFNGYVDMVSFGFRGEDITTFNFETAEVPEPGGIALLGLGMLGLAAARRRSRR